MQIFLRFSNVESIVYVGVWIDSVADESFLLFVSCYLACWFEESRWFNRFSSSDRFQYHPLDVTSMREKIPHRSVLADIERLYNDNNGRTTQQLRDVGMTIDNVLRVEH